MDDWVAQTNFSRIAIQPENRIGLVVPVFRRPQYLGPCLDSLGASDLTDTILCLVDESTADEGLPEFAGYRRCRNLDSAGGGIANVWEETGGDLKAIKQRCDADPDCRGFNTLGWLKRIVTPTRDWKPMPHRVFALYLKEPAPDPLPPGPQRDDRAAREAARMIREFDLPGVPIIKIFKKKHGNMYQSLEMGWDLLSEDYDCSFMACLDSDAVVKPDWLPAISDLFHNLRQGMPHPRLMVSGFRSGFHPELARHPRFALKARLGGINLFFRRDLYPEIRPCLNSDTWDDRISSELYRKGGRLACTVPSVVQHSGKHGMWSDGRTCDRAVDFTKKD